MRRPLVLLLTVVTQSCVCPGGGDEGTGGGRATGGGAVTGGGAAAGGGVAAGGGAGAGGGAMGGGVATSASVIQHHNHASRDGVYVDPALTKAAVATLHRVQNFHPTVTGEIAAQPLFLESALVGHDVLIVATGQNAVYAFDAATGTPFWRTDLAPPVPQGALPCGNATLGITGTPYADLQRRQLYFDAMTMVGGDVGPRHLVYALNFEDGQVAPGWPVDVQAALTSNTPAFTALTQHQPGAVLLLDGILYVPYGGYSRDCGTSHGWVVGIDVETLAVTAWATPARGGGISSVNGVSSDGTSLFVSTGNTFGTNTWMGGDALIRLNKGPVFSGDTADAFAPSNWLALDNARFDVGGAAAVMVDAPGATPSSLMLALGKDGNAYVLNRAALGGVGGELTSKAVATQAIQGAPAVFTTPAGTFIAFRVEGGTGVSCPNRETGNQVVVTLSKTNPPGLDTAWCSKESTLASPVVSMADAQGRDAMVWSIGTVRNTRLFAYDATTGDELFAGGTTADAITPASFFMTPIIAKGRVYVAAKNGVYAFAP